MYHMGVCKAMDDTGCMPRVVSGTSGGSIVAGMLAGATRFHASKSWSPDCSVRCNADYTEIGKSKTVAYY